MLTRVRGVIFKNIGVKVEVFVTVIFVITALNVSFALQTVRMTVDGVFWWEQVLLVKTPTDTEDKTHNKIRQKMTRILSQSMEWFVKEF